LLKSVSAELCRFAYSLGKPTRLANELICRIMQNTDCRIMPNTYYRIMQIRKLVERVILVGRISKSGTSKPRLVVGRVLLARRISKSGQWLGECY